jgi:hypothetical protein
MILRATWPSDEPIQESIIQELLHQSIPTFKYTANALNKKSQRRGRKTAGQSMATLLQENPYHMTLHKIWTKTCESDWRTVLKSLYLLHYVVRNTRPLDSSSFREALIKMSKVKNPKSKELEARYFDASIVGRIVNLESAPHVGFLKFYAKHVISSIKHLGGR